MKVLLIYPDNQRYNYMMPLGLAYIGGTLRRAGHKVSAIDIDAYKYTPNEVRAILKKLDYDVVCTGGLITTYHYERWLVSEIKKQKPGAKIIAGGNLITSAPTVFMENSVADVGVIGEGEYATLDILKRWESKKPLDDVSGIVFRKDGELVETPKRGYIQNLDELPFPARDLFSGEHYTRIGNVIINGKRLRSQGLLSNRGCPYKCTFCCRAFGNEVRLRDPKAIIEEVKMLKKDYKIDAFFFCDELFTVSKERVFQVSEAIIASGVNLKWKTVGRINLVDRDAIRIMKRSGCFEIGYGVESGSVKILKEMKKGLTPQLSHDVIKMTYEEGVNPTFSFMLGMPGDDRETMEETMRLRKLLNTYRSTPVVNIFYATPYPGTELYENLRKSGKIEDEKQYIEALSSSGLAWNFLINLTNLPDSELIKIKNGHRLRNILDFYLKHPGKIMPYIIRPFLEKITGIHLLKRVIGKLKRIAKRKQSIFFMKGIN